MTDKQIATLSELCDSGVLNKNIRDALEACIAAVRNPERAMESKVRLKLFRIYTNHDEFYVSAETRPLAYQKVRQYARAHGHTPVYLESCDEIADCNERTGSPKLLP